MAVVDMGCALGLHCEKKHSLYCVLLTVLQCVLVVAVLLSLDVCGFRWMFVTGRAAEMAVCQSTS
jgi:hypothetical protein